jgi:hypothetical protein
MGKKKIEDHQIMNAVEELSAKKQELWRKRFGDLDGYPDQHRREEIQSMVDRLFDIQMSKSGFRSRLKKLVEKGELNQWKPFARTTFYRKSYDK